MILNQRCPRKIIYLHGFNSSHKSTKAQLLLEHMQAAGRGRSLLLPDLSPYPDCAIKQITQLIESHSAAAEETKLCFVGSSLGGYYATFFAEQTQSPAVLINPSIRPYETLADYLGENKNYYTMEKWCLDKTHIQQLLDIDVTTITQPERYLVLLQTGDEVLDYQQAKNKYERCQLIVEQGGDHSFIGFEHYIDKILGFAHV